MYVKKILLMLLLVSSGMFCCGQQKKINVYAFVAEECPISIFMASALRSVAALYENRANFFLVFPVKTSTEKTAAAFKSTHKLSQFTIQVDTDQAITKRYAAKVTPEVVITNENDSVIYKGRINDAYNQPGKRKHLYKNNDLATALEFISGGNAVPQPWKKAVGCFITIKK